jgi:hypothetical protein
MQLKFSICSTGYILRTWQRKKEGMGVAMDRKERRGMEEKVGIGPYDQLFNGP